MKKLIVFLLSLVAFIPLFTDKQVFLPDVTTKSFLFAVIVSVTFIVFVAGFIASDNFRLSITDRIKQLIKNPILITFSVFILVYIVTAFLSQDIGSAFWGTLSRSEGVVGMLYLYVFMVMASLSFEKEDWNRFFKVVLVVTALVICKELVQYAKGTNRPGSWIGNSAFLAEYLVFGLFSAGVTILESGKFWKVAGVIMVPIILLGILLTQTRGALLGLVVGGVVMLIVAAIQGNQLIYKKISLRTVSIAVLLTGFVFSLVFITTRHADFWQSIPGLSRVARIDSNDDTTSSRLLVWKSSFKMVDPSRESFKKLALGWGPENFYIGFQKYYDPEIFLSDIKMFDRPHNKLIEILVSMGIVGLVSYLAIWVALMASIRKVPDYKIRLGLYGVMIAYLVHLLFLFDIIITSLMFMALLAYIITFGRGEGKAIKSSVDARLVIVTSLWGIAGAVMIVCFFIGTLAGYVRMHRYIGLVSGGNVKTVVSEVPQLVAGSPTYIDTFIVGDFLNNSAQQYNAQRDPRIEVLLDTAIDLGKEFIEKYPYDYRLKVTMVNALNSRGDIESLKMSELYIGDLIANCPAFPRYHYMLGLNYGQQGRFDEAVQVFEKQLAEHPSPLVEYQYGWLLVMKGPKYYDKAFDTFEHSFIGNHDLSEKDYVKLKQVYKVFVDYLTWKKDGVRLNLAQARLQQYK